jgi:predicted transposase/invertase (TIGR01784 family)
MLQKLRLETLELENNSFVDENLEEYFADILYTCQYGASEKIRIALLYEHKSYKEDYPHWQLNKYMLSVWQSGLKQKKNKPIPIIPIVIYHGKEKWTYQPMNSYFGNIDDNLFKYIPNFEYHLFDLNKISDEKITNFKNKFLAVSALLFKYSSFKKYVKKIENELIDLMKLIDNQDDNKFIKSVVLYIQNTEELKITELFAIFSKVSLNAKNTAMTTAEQLINQGISQGINQGISLGRNQGIEITQINTIKKGYLNGISAIMLANISDLPLEKVEEIIAKVKSGLL